MSGRDRPLHPEYRGRLAAALLVTALTAAAFWPIVRNGFVKYDDFLYVVDNRRLAAGFTRENLVWAFGTTHTGYWHPLTWLAHILDVKLFGLNPLGHHLMSLGLHLANALLLLAVLGRMTGALWPSAFTAAAFAVHPLHVESVAWVAERKDVLSTFLGLLAVAAHHRYARSPSPGRYLPTALALALGLLAKPMLVTVPFVLLLLDYWPLGRMGTGGKAPNLGALAGLAAEKIPLFLLAAASSAVTFVAQRDYGTMNMTFAYGFGHRLANAILSCAAYVRLTAWPSGLAVFYPFPGRLPPGPVIAAAIFLAALTVSAVMSWRRRPYLAVGWFWFLGTLVPVSGLVQVGTQAMADRYTYVPAVGLFIMAAWGVGGLVSWRPRLRPAAAWLGAAVLSALAVASSVQTFRWRDSVTLFRHALEATGDNWLAHVKLGNVELQQGRLAEAAAHYEAALRSMPFQPEAHHNLGLVLARQGKAREAIRHLRIAAAALPSDATARVNLGKVLEGQGMTEEAVGLYREALRLDPYGTEARMPLDRALRKLQPAAGPPPQRFQ